MNDKISITNLAKLRNVTTETLRHYDRIGLFKPTYVNPTTGYRYYSILQYEKLGTIKELRQLGMGLESIKKYFDNRNVGKSLTILSSKHNDLKQKIVELQLLEKIISEKIVFLKNTLEESQIKEIVVKQLPDRYIITFDKIIKNDLDLSYAVLELENALEEIAPIIASNRIGFIISKEDIISSHLMQSTSAFVFTKDNIKVADEHIKKVASGKFACMYYNGKPLSRGDSVTELVDFINKNEYVIDGDALLIVQIDITVTDNLEEESIEIQIPIKNT